MSLRRSLRKRAERRLSALLEQAPLHTTRGPLTTGRGATGWRAVRWEGDNRLGHHSAIGAGGTVGRGSRFGPYCHLSAPMTVGRYCSVGGGVAIVTNAHPLRTAALFTSVELFEGRRRDLAPPEGVTIGNDVWIGSNATIVDGTTIGDGAVVAAGAVVAGDVSAFEVVGGVPAKLIRPRFDPETTDLVRQLSWWTAEGQELDALEPVLALDLTTGGASTLAALREAVARRQG